MGVKRGEAKADVTEYTDLVDREQARRLRAQAWRHLRRINPVTARAAWRIARERMSLARFAKKRDKAEPDIVKALEAVGCEVWALDTPCDLLTLYRGRWQPLEVKTPYGKREPKARVDKRQEVQRQFLESTRIPIVTTPLEALEAIGATAY